ncbi:hypothetical protein MA6G0728R_5382 [Mycobacteroides abscessus 6G-0728-R]|nr:hypothetical protein MA6G0125S_5379 [Mycobacteroides abscessus 6G-0125-S]EIU64238.1 hypothetical protein MA6G0728S_5355 [Mycobacteroides abscessus 6G-0728-S]EIU74735.1 hypothetical protein MA6G1108_5383 [Mycobacteroides abscessus 6G-1108]EIV03102.1 hypothetical protein MA6G0728R_5382 [Mycobacteroides abscessus 6G-0728-R]
MIAQEFAEPAVGLAAPSSTHPHSDDNLEATRIQQTLK